MRPNPVLKKLGYSEKDRLVIIHTDDIGMCYSSIAAFEELIDFGIISSGATMVPCAWFPRVANFCREVPQVDMGVHITLTSEWDFYRWGPISTRDISSGLIDTEGYFYRSTEEAQAHGEPNAVRVEIVAQINRALNAGIKISHIDTHMGTVAHPYYMPSYIQAGLHHRIPVMIPRKDAHGYEMLGMDSNTADMAARYVHALEEQGVPLIDEITGLELDQPLNRIDQAKNILNNLKPGITHFMIHPSKDTPELRSITPDWRCRVADYTAFSSEEMQDFINNSGLHVIGYQSLHGLMANLLL